MFFFVGGFYAELRNKQFFYSFAREISEKSFLCDEEKWKQKKLRFVLSAANRTKNERHCCQEHCRRGLAREWKLNSTENRTKKERKKKPSQVEIINKKTDYNFGSAVCQSHSHGQPQVSFFLCFRVVFLRKSQKTIQRWNDKEDKTWSRGMQEEDLGEPHNSTIIQYISLFIFVWYF